MPWCPKCKNSYPQDCKTCLICGTQLVHSDPADEDIILAQTADQPASGCVQMIAIWFTGLIAVLALYLLAGALSEASTLLVALVAVPGSLAIVFSGGYFMGSLLTPLYIWLAWAIAALPAYVLMSYWAGRTDCRDSSCGMLTTMLICAGFGALITFCGKRYRHTRSLTYIIVPLICAGIAIAWSLSTAPS